MTTSKIIASLVDEGHEDLAERLLKSLEGCSPYLGITADGTIHPPVYRGFDEHSPKRTTGVKKVKDDDMVTVPGYGQMKLGQLKKEVIGKCEDLVKRAKQGSFHTIGDANFDVLANMWKVLAKLR